jgi:hypothetical protein
MSDLDSLKNQVGELSGINTDVSQGSPEWSSRSTVKSLLISSTALCDTKTFIAYCFVHKQVVGGGGGSVANWPNIRPHSSKEAE